MPDVVGDPEGICYAARPQTLKNYTKWEKRLRKYKTPLAFAVQDGMKMTDVPCSAEVVFVGGSTEWKVKTIPYWCDNFPRVHVARVNGWTRLLNCYQAGAESVDGTGYFKAGWNQRPMVNLRLFLRWQSGEPDISLFHLRNLSTSKRRYLLQQLDGVQFDFSTLPLFGSV